MTLDVLNSPALPLLLRLESEGFTFAASDGRLLVRPHLPASAKTEVAAHRAALITLVRICDEGVVARRQAMEQEIVRHPRAAAGALVAATGVPYVAGRCFSCGDALPAPVFGRCWRCALAWRLALGAPIPALADAYDAQRVVA